MEQTEQTIDRIYDLVKQNNDLLIKIDSKINKKINSTDSKFEKAVEYIKNKSNIDVHISRIADLIYPRIYHSRPQAVKAIKQMISAGILKQEKEFITKGNIS